MVKNKQAFTLIELIGVIALLGILLIIITPLINKTIKKGKEQADLVTINNIVLSAKHWGVDNKDKLPKEKGKKRNIWLSSDLQSGGYIEKNIKIPSSGRDLTEACVEVRNNTLETSPKKVYDYVYNGECIINNKLSIIAKDTDNKEVKSQTWTNKDLNLISVTDYDGEYQWTKNGKTIDNETKRTYKLTVDNGVETNSNYYNVIFSAEKQLMTAEDDYYAYIDKKAPIITTTTIVSTANQLTLKLEDKGSGLSDFAITTSNVMPTTWNKLSGASFTQSFTYDTGKYYIYAKDLAGNITSKAVDVMNLAKPTCSIGLSGTMGDNSWYKSNVAVNLNTSGTISAKGLSTTSGTANGLSTVNHTNDGSITYYGYVSNAAGANNCSITFKKDTALPTCSWSGESTSWTNANRAITVKGSDAHSGINPSYQTNSWTYTGTTKTAALSYTIRDNAGNTALCSKTANVYVDKIAPSCSWSGESTSWTNSNRAITVKGSDAHSGINPSYQTNSWTYTGTTKTAALSYTIRDNAGNSAVCSKTANVYVDKTPPYCGEGTCDNSSNCGMYGGGGSYFSGRTCGATYWNRVYDAHSGVKSAKQRKCYMKAWGSPASTSHWGSNTCNMADDAARNYLKGLGWSNAQYNNAVGKTSGTVAGGINVGYSKIAYQFQVTDYAGNVKDCGTHIKSNNFGTSDC